MTLEVQTDSSPRGPPSYEENRRAARQASSQRPLASIPSRWLDPWVNMETKLCRLVPIARSDTMDTSPHIHRRIGTYDYQGTRRRNAEEQR